MSFPNDLHKQITEYCIKHLPSKDWYDKQFDFIQDTSLKNRLSIEWRSIRFTYKIYEGLKAKEENYLFEVRSQIFAYASIYEAVIDYVLNNYYSNTEEYEKLIYHDVLLKISIPTHKEKDLKSILEHDGKQIVPCYYDKKKKDQTKIKFEEKCEAAENIGLIHSIIKSNGNIINLPKELREIYSFRNGIHLMAEKRKNIHYELKLSRNAYWRMQPFLAQIKEKLISDNKIP